MQEIERFTGILQICRKQQVFTFMSYLKNFAEITILLSVCVFLGMVANMTPPTSEALPLVTKTFIFNFLSFILSFKFSEQFLDWNIFLLQYHSCGLVSRLQRYRAEFPLSNP